MKTIICDYPECGLQCQLQYPGNDPENGPARAYCKSGHSQCYRCGNTFQAIVHVPESTRRWDDDDPMSEFKVEACSYESDWCPECEEQGAEDGEQQ